MAEAASGYLASFDYLDSVVDAIHDLRKAGFKDLTVRVTLADGRRALGGTAVVVE